MHSKMRENSRETKEIVNPRVTFLGMEIMCVSVSVHVRTYMYTWHVLDALIFSQLFSFMSKPPMVSKLAVPHASSGHCVLQSISSAEIWMWECLRQ